MNIKSPKPQRFMNRGVSRRSDMVRQGPSAGFTRSRSRSGDHMDPDVARSRAKKGDQYDVHFKDAPNRGSSRTARTIYDDKGVDWPKGRATSVKGKLDPTFKGKKTRVKSMRGKNASGANRGRNAGGR